MFMESVVLLMMIDRGREASGGVEPVHGNRLAGWCWLGGGN